MGQRLLTITVFSLGLAVYLAAQYNYIPNKYAFPFLLVWVFVVRKVALDGDWTAQPQAQPVRSLSCKSEAGTRRLLA